MTNAKPIKLNSDGKRDMKGRMALSFKRAQAIGFDWTAVDRVEMLGALTAALSEGAAIMLSPASGGRGVCVKVFDGDQKSIEYAGLPEELTNLFGQILDHYGSTSEDTRAVIAQHLSWAAAAD